MPSQESARKPRENIETLIMDSRSPLSSIKLMEETDGSVQTYCFLEVKAVRYDEKPEKDKDVISVISWQEGRYCAWQFDWINQLVASHEDVLTSLRTSRSFLNRKFEDQHFFRLGHIYFDLVVFQMWRYAWRTNFWCHILIDRLITNQIALSVLPVRERTELGKMLEIDCRRFLFSCSLVRSPRPLEKERNRLLRRLRSSPCDGWVDWQGSKCKCTCLVAFSLRTKSLTQTCIYGDCNVILVFMHLSVSSPRGGGGWA